MQEADDYYQPIITGNYLRLVRNFNLLNVVSLENVWIEGKKKGL